VQFFTVELSGPATINHSAVEVPSPFPSTPYIFPSQAQNPVGSAISSQLWSTGRVPNVPDSNEICFSQVFTVPNTTGVFEFGDFDYFNLANARDVLVVSNTGARTHARLMPLGLLIRRGR